MTLLCTFKVTNLISYNLNAIDPEDKEEDGLDYGLDQISNRGDEKYESNRIPSLTMLI